MVEDRLAQDIINAFGMSDALEVNGAHLPSRTSPSAAIHEGKENDQLKLL